MSPGIQVRHSKLCPTRSGGPCTCKPTYQANVWSAREGKRVFKTFPTLAEAKAWRAEAQVALRRGTMRAGSLGTLREAAEAWLDGARSGAIRTRSGHHYKPSAIRSYETVARHASTAGARRCPPRGHPQDRPPGHGRPALCRRARR